MDLRKLLDGMPGVTWEDRFDGRFVGGISCDSREDQPDGLFVALGGFNFNGLDFIKEAISRGARTIVKGSGGNQAGGYQIPDTIAIVQADDPKLFLRAAAQRFYGAPSSKVGVIGVTGTNGKTTITYLLESIIHADQRQCGVIGTVNHRIGAQVFPSRNTTPGVLDNQRYLAHLARLQVPWCAMEVSSHALHQGRVEGISFAAAMFTNLTQDHLDYHKTMEDYFQAKTLLFTGLGSQAVSILNTDDPYGRRLVHLSRGKVLTYGINSYAQVMARQVDYQLSGTVFEITFPESAVNIRTPLIGKYNVYNILAAAACAYALGFSVEVIKQGIEGLSHVPGRLEGIRNDQGIHVFIDYAHTEDGLVNVLKSLRAVSDGKIIVVFGCGGDRDKGKRPKMGRVVCLLADQAIITSDNPRSEDPRAIIDQVSQGFEKDNYEICEDRGKAIAKAIASAGRGDVVLLAGKGHEAYQVLKEGSIPFNERAIAQTCLVSRT